MYLFACCLMDHALGHAQKRKKHLGKMQIIDNKGARAKPPRSKIWAVICGVLCASSAAITISQLSVTEQNEVAFCQPNNQKVVLRLGIQVSPLLLGIAGDE